MWVVRMASSIASHVSSSSSRSLISATSLDEQTTRFSACSTCGP